MADGQPLVIGQANSGDATTKLERSGTAVNAALDVTNLNGTGIRGKGTGKNSGVIGESASGYGVVGESSSNIGVQATSTTGTGLVASSTDGPGVVGNSVNETGVEGQSRNAAGVSGISDAVSGVHGKSVSGNGVFGISDGGPGAYGTSTNGPGTIGVSSRGPGAAGLSVHNNGVTGTSRDFFGVYARSDKNTGVLGTSEEGMGVAGISTNSPGVHGTSTNDSGVVGTAIYNAGVYGSAPNGTGIQGEGVVGTRGTSTKGFGVIGTSQDGTGVLGESGKGFGVWATSGSGTAVNAWSKTGTAVDARSQSGPAVRGYARTGPGVVGICANAGRLVEPGILGVAIAPGMPAAFFSGDVVVFDDLIVTGNKHAAVRHPDGSHRALYCMESPESWFEDFGRGRLVRGKATIRLDPRFSALVRTDDYHVFLSPEGRSAGLYVSRRSRTGFEVREYEQERGASSLTFSYRVVARRKDVAARRFPKIKLPVRPNVKDLLKDLPGPLTERSRPRPPKPPRAFEAPAAIESSPLGSQRPGLRSSRGGTRRRG